MAVQSWLESVEQELVRSKVSVAYRERLLGELRDHVEDVYCEERNRAMSAEAVQDGMLEARLGKPAEVASAAKKVGTKSYFARRHPLVTYLLIPIPALVLLWITYTATLAGIFSLFDQYKSAEWAVSAASLLTHGIAYVPAILLTLLFAWLAIRSNTKIAWWLSSSAIVAFVSGLMMVNLRFPTTPGTGSLNVGLGFPPPFAHWPQMAIPLAITIAFVCYYVRKRRSRPDTPAA